MSPPKPYLSCKSVLPAFAVVSPTDNCFPQTTIFAVRDDPQCCVALAALADAPPVDTEDIKALKNDWLTDSVCLNHRSLLHPSID
jgi:hypothetical protein